MNNQKINGSSKPKDSCGIIGIYDKDNLNTANLVYLGMMALQHRGQESAGIAINNQGITTCYKEMGLVQEVFDDKIIDILKGYISLGHVKYGSNHDSNIANAQPIVVKDGELSIAIAMNGAITNVDEIRKRLENSKSPLEIDTECETIAALIIQNYKGDVVEAVSAAINELKGGFAIGMLINNKLIGVRDKYGIRPLSIGKLPNGYSIASESVAFDSIGAELVRDLKPGEIVVIDEQGLKSVELEGSHKKSLCAFEYIYFARPDSNLNGISVYKTREYAGRQLAIDSPVLADCVIGVPDSGSAAAMGFSAQSGIPYCLGLVKNRYIGRSFIEPTQAQRELAVKLKLNPMKDIVKGKRLVLIDDSIVRGTTTLHIIESLREAGAIEVHVRISSPEVMDICYFGIDIPNKNDLISTKHSRVDVCKMIGADSLGFLSIDGLRKTLENSSEEDAEMNDYCMGCLNGKWPGINR